MQLLITGAASPRGQATLAAALAQGHNVQAVLSPTESPPNNISCHPHLTWLKIDWLEDSGQEGVTALQGTDAVIHIDEVNSGPFERHYLGTVQTTERLIQAMVRNRVRRLILTSSLAVYGYGQLATDQLLDETSPLEAALETRPAYVQAKLMQEALLCSFNYCWGGQTTILRPGFNYSSQQLWQPILGLDDGLSQAEPEAQSVTETGAIRTSQTQRYWQISPQGSLPLLYAEHFASAAIAALQPIAIGETFNLTDDHLPSRIDYGKAVAEIMPTPQAIPVPWALAKAAERMQRRTGIALPRLPRSLDRQELNASFKPLRYSNLKAKRMLRWRPNTHWQTVLQQAEATATERTTGLLVSQNVAGRIESHSQSLPLGPNPPFGSAQESKGSGEDEANSQTKEHGARF